MAKMPVRNVLLKKVLFRYYKILGSGTKVGSKTYLWIKDTYKRAMDI